MIIQLINKTRQEKVSTVSYPSFGIIYCLESQNKSIMSSAGENILRNTGGVGSMSNGEMSKNVSFKALTDNLEVSLL